MSYQRILLLKGSMEPFGFKWEKHKVCAINWFASHFPVLRFLTSLIWADQSLLISSSGWESAAVMCSISSGGERALALWGVSATRICTHLYLVGTILERLGFVMAFFDPLKLVCYLQCTGIDAKPVRSGKQQKIQLFVYWVDYSPRSTQHQWFKICTGN